MNWGSIALWGFVGTIVLTSIMAATQQLRLTRMSLPLVLGTMLTSNRDRAPLLGIGFHIRLDLRADLRPGLRELGADQLVAWDGKRAGACELCAASWYADATEPTPAYGE